MLDQQQNQTPALPVGKHSWPASVWGGARRLTSRSLNGLASTAKTSLLRQDRVSDEHHMDRLDVCRNCPGGHATFGKDGALRTCGPMLTSLTVEGQSTCGCVLSRKARDLKQACPFGYWESADRRAAWASIKPRAVVAGLSDMLMSRRAMLGATAGVGASLLLTQKVQAAEGGRCYIPITPCDQGDATHIHCSKVEGMSQGDSFRNRSDQNCYKIAAVKAVDKYEQLATRVSGDSDGCEDCDGPPLPCEELPSSYALTASGTICCETASGSMETNFSISGSIYKQAPGSGFECRYYSIIMSDPSYCDSALNGGGEAYFTFDLRRSLSTDTTWSATVGVTQYGGGYFAPSFSSPDGTGTISGNTGVVCSFSKRAKVVDITVTIS